jgi:hypothetical protein
LAVDNLLARLQSYLKYVQDITEWKRTTGDPKQLVWGDAGYFRHPYEDKLNPVPHTWGKSISTFNPMYDGSQNNMPDYGDWRNYRDRMPMVRPPLQGDPPLDKGILPNLNPLPKLNSY